MLAVVLASGPAAAAPFIPASDADVLERLPRVATAGAGGELAGLRRALAREPGNAALAARLAGRYMAEVAAEGDPRFVGYAQAALAPWWTASDPPSEVRLMRAVVHQFGHQFDAALADLDAVVRAEPDHVQAWAWIAAISLVRADHDRAREACRQVARTADALGAAACTASVDAVSGQAAAAVSALQRALATAHDAPPEARLWALTRLAETLERLGDAAAAEQAYTRALALGVTDGYLLAAYADLLLDQGRAPEVLRLLQGRERSDLLLLRLAVAARATAHPSLAAWSAALAARFEAARLRGDTTHEKEEARYALQVQGDAVRALPLAIANFEGQREPADARILLEAALAARRPEAAEPALAWLRRTRIESRILAALADRLGAVR